MSPVVLMRRALAATLSMLALAAAAPSAAAPVVRDGREWLQVNALVNRSWDQLDAACPVSQGRACSGAGIDGYTWASGSDVRALFEGYFSAPRAPNSDTFGTPLGSVNWQAAAVLGGAPEHLFESGDVLALAVQALLTDFSPTVRTILIDAPSLIIDRILMTDSRLDGWTADFDASTEDSTGAPLRVGGAAAASMFFDQRSCFAIHLPPTATGPFCPDADSVSLRVAAVGGNPTIASSTRGAWLFRELPAPVPEPASLPLVLMAAATMIGLRQHHRARRVSARPSA